MSCTYLRIRSKDYQKYYFCKKNNKKIEIQDCKNCEEKAYKKNKSMRCKKHNRTKATQIQKYVKEIVWYRDKRRCIFCNKLVPIFNANAHFIPRSAGGRGIEENMFTACDFCHNEQDNGLNTKAYDLKVENYLRSIYGPNWNKEKLIYNKYKRKEEM